MTPIERIHTLVESHATAINAAVARAQGMGVNFIITPIP
jgi:hypothetical protein